MTINISWMQNVHISTYKFPIVLYVSLYINLP